MLLSGREPFAGVDDNDLIHRNKNVIFEFAPAEIWKEISLEAKLFIQSCFVPIARDRLTPADARRHPWLADLE